MIGIEVSDEDRDFAQHVTICGSWSGKYNTIHLAKRCIAEGVSGDFVECGVHSGGHPALMGYALRKYAPNAARKIHLFDSWECQPQASLHDDASYRDQLGVNLNPLVGVPSGVFESSLEHCQENLRDWGAPMDAMVYHKGWLQEVLPRIAVDFPTIALLRVDVDLYDSTVPVFEYLYDKVVSGGYIVSDDWGETDGPDACRQATHDFFDRRRLPRPTVTRLPVTPGTVWWKKP